MAIGLYAPAGTPRAAVDRLSRALRRTVGSGSVIAALETSGFVVRYEDGAQVRERLAAEQQEIMDLGRRRRPGGAATQSGR